MPVARLFCATALPGSEGELKEKINETSVSVVSGEPGNLGYISGSSTHSDRRAFMFISFWEDFSSVAARFGDRWREPFLPAGYEDLIEECTLEHFEIGSCEFGELERRGVASD